MDPLWLNCKGEKETNISRLVIAFFRQNADLHITTTTLRALVEIQADQMHKKGTISLVEREAIANSNGHCLTSTVGVRFDTIYSIKTYSDCTRQAVTVAIGNSLSFHKRNFTRFVHFIGLNFDESS